MSETKSPNVVTTRDIKSDTSFFHPADYVVGHYDANGKLDATHKGGALSGASELMKSIAANASKMAGAVYVPPKSNTPVAVKPKRGRPSKKQSAAVATPIILTPPPAYAPTPDAAELSNGAIQEMITKNKASIKVTFETAFGQIGMQTLDIYETDLAVGLLFAKANDITFTPKPGQNFRVLIDRNENETEVFTGFYADVTFSLPNGQKLMLLFKANAPEAEEPAES